MTISFIQDGFGTFGSAATAPSALHGFQVLRPLGRGAASSLYAAFDPETREVFTLKHVIRRDGREREDQRFLDQVENEYAIASRLDVPGIRAARRIVRVRPLLRVREVLLLLDFVDGTPLDRLEHTEWRITLGRFADAARALGRLHACGVVHADFKPGNVIVDDSNEIVLIDLGQACSIGQRKARIQGTPGYMAPEQRRLEPLGPATDAFALGASILRTALRDKEGCPGSATGSAVGSQVAATHEAFAALTADPVEAAAALARHDAPSGLPELVASLLQAAPTRRPARFNGIADELEAIGGG